MSDFDDEYCVVVPPQGTRGIVKIAESLLARTVPHVLSAPTKLDVIKLAEEILPQEESMIICPAPAAEVGYRNLAKTLSDGKPGECIEIIIENEHYKTLFHDDGRSNRARLTVTHEIGHAVLHTPFIRLNAMAGLARSLPRARNGEVVTYQQPEWQAWAFGTTMLVPPSTLNQLPRSMSIHEIAELYGISARALQVHMNRLRTVGLYQ